jgi:hypothetical protein
MLQIFPWAMGGLFKISLTLDFPLLKPFSDAIFIISSTMTPTEARDVPQVKLNIFRNGGTREKKRRHFDPS